jgi:hypothetical protein
MKQKIIPFLKKHVLAIWIIAAAVSLSTIVALAAYKNQSNVAKKVVATQATTDIRFSSNYLEDAVDSSDPNNIKYKGYTVLISNDEAINVDIRNYGKTNATLAYPAAVNFNLTATLTDSSGTALTQAKAAELLGSDTITVTLNNSAVITLSSSALTGTSAQTITPGGTPTINGYKLNFPSASTKACVKIIADPSTNHRDLHAIGAVFTVSDKSSIQSSGWTGSFNDPETKGPSAYDVLNYSITGYGASNAATIKWDPNVVNIEANGFAFNTGITPTGPTDIADPSGWKQITFSLAAEAGRYSFYVFKADGFSDSITWDDIDDYLIFDDGISD